MTDLERERSGVNSQHDPQLVENRSLDSVSDESLRTIIGQFHLHHDDRDSVITPEYLRFPLQDTIGLTTGQFLDVLREVRHRKIIDTSEGVRHHGEHRYRIVGFNDDQVVAFVCLSWGYHREFELTRRRYSLELHSRIFGKIDWQRVVRETKEALGTYYIRDLIHEPVLSPVRPQVVPKISSPQEVRVKESKPPSRSKDSPVLKKEVHTVFVPPQPNQAPSFQRQAILKPEEPVIRPQPQQDARRLSPQELHTLSKWNVEQIQAVIARLRHLSSVDTISASIAPFTVIAAAKKVMAFRRGNLPNVKGSVDDDVTVGEVLQSLTVCIQYLEQYPTLEHLGNLLLAIDRQIQKNHES